MMSGAFWDVAYAPFLGAWAAGATASGGVLAWDLRNGRVERIGQHEGAARAVAFLAGGGAVSVGDDGCLGAWRAGSGRPRGSLVSVTAGALWSLAVRSDGHEALLGTSDGSVEVWHPIARERVTVLHGHHAAVLGISYSPSERWAVTASADGTARVWDVDGRRCVAVLTGHAERVWAAAWRRDGRTLATASADGTVRLVEAGTWRLLGVVDLATPEPRAISYRAPGVTDLAYLPDGRLVLGTTDGSLRLVDTSFRVTTHGALPGPVVSLAVHPSRRGEVLCGLIEGGAWRVTTLDGQASPSVRAVRAHA